MRTAGKKATATTDPTRRAYWPMVVIVAAACAFCWPVFIGRIMSPADMMLLFLPWKHALASQFPGFHGPHNPMLDPIQQYLPWRMYAVESLRSGVVPLWNPYSFMGTPFLANLQSALLYPPNVLFLLTGAAYGFGVSAILHLIAGGLLMYAFLRTLDLRPAAATLGALVFMFNGFTVTWLEYPTLSLWTFMWLPGVLVTYELAVRRPVSVWPVLCALLLGMTFLGGHLQIASYLVMAFLIYAVARAVAQRRTTRPVVALGLAVAPLVLAVALAAGQILPTLELAAHSGRVSHGLAGALETAFPITHLVLYFVPNFFGNPVHPPYWGNFQDPSAFNFFETACYVGILPLALAVWGLRRWREVRAWYFAVLIVFALLSAIGAIYPVLYYIAPGFRELAGLGRILCLAAFGVAGLAAVGMEELLARTEATKLGRSVPVLVLVASLGLFACSQLFASAINELGWGFARYLLIQSVVWLALSLTSMALIQARARLRLSANAFAVAALALVVLDLFGFGIGFNPYVEARLAYPETDSIRWLKEHVGHDRFTSLASKDFDWLPHNASMIFGLRDIHGSDSLRIKESFELVSPPDGNQAKYPDPNSPLLDELGVRYLMTERPLSGKWKLVYDGEARIYENRQAWPRASVFRNRLTSPAEFLVDDPDRVVLRVSGPGLLMLRDPSFPGWHAWTDSQPAQRDKEGATARRVIIPDGEHTVEFRYEPATYRVGLFVSLLALALLFGAGAALFFLSRPRASETAARSNANSTGAPSALSS